MAEKSELNQAVTLLARVFNRYSGKDGDHSTLTRAELKELMQKELGCSVENIKDKERVDSFFKELDKNKDDKVDFMEFGQVVLNYAQIIQFISSLTEVKGE